MKNILIPLFCEGICTFIFNNAIQAQTDVGLQIRDSVFNYKSNYIGQAFGSLIEDLHYDITPLFKMFACGILKF